MSCVFCNRPDGPSLEERVRSSMTWAASQRPPRLSDMEGTTLFGLPIVEVDDL